MKLRLGQKAIKINAVEHIERIGHRIATLTLKNDDTLRVICGVNALDVSFPSFLRTPDDRKDLIQRLK